MDQLKKAEELAVRILKSSRNELIVALRYMDLALCKLRFQAKAIDRTATDGVMFWFHPRYIFDVYQAGNTELNHVYLHTVLHCVFYHPFVSPEIDRPLWNLACDIAVEDIINDLHLKQLETSVSTQRDAELAALRKKYGKLTAEQLYKAFRNRAPGRTELSRLIRLFTIDEHDPWYPPEKAPQNGASVQGTVSGQAVQGVSLSDPLQNLLSSGNADQIEWQMISERLKVDLETRSEQWGDTPGYFTQSLTEVNRERYDYSEFLRKFAVSQEELHINDDEFDYIYYTYGLQLYKKVPLVEPLEYQNLRRIREFVIAIDTSGSVSGELVQKFINKTYHVLMQQESFFRKVNIHLIQCDTKIHTDDKITCREDFLRLMKDYELHGFGGTDFRPVFRYVEEQTRNGEFQHLNGLLYFTDGYGTFPEKKPPYKTAFIFIDDEYGQPEIPVWAMKLVLSGDEL